MPETYDQTQQYKSLVVLVRGLMASGGVLKVAEFLTNLVKEHNVPAEYVFLAMMASLKADPKLHSNAKLSLPTVAYIKNLMEALSTTLTQVTDPTRRDVYLEVRDVVVHTICDEYLRASMAVATGISVLIGGMPLEFTLDAPPDISEGIQPYLTGVPEGCTIH